MVDTTVSRRQTVITPINTSSGTLAPTESTINTFVGTVTLNGTTPVTVANTNVGANSIIVFTLKTVGGTVGAQPVIDTITAGTGFTVKGTASDTSVYNYSVVG